MTRKTRAADGTVTETTVPRVNYRECLTPVRAFYLDLACWAVEDPARWGPWVVPCPVGSEEIDRRKDKRRRKARSASFRWAWHIRSRDSARSAGNLNRRPYRGRAISLKAPEKLPRILTVAEMQAILDACTRLRDRFFFALLHDSGSRAGEVLGLRHEDIAAAECEITIVARENANGRTGQVRGPDGSRRAGADPALCRLPARRVRRHRQ